VGVDDGVEELFGLIEDWCTDREFMPCQLCALRCFVDGVLLCVGFEVVL